MFDRILVPTDGSEEMDLVVENAVELGELCDAELHALYVVDETAFASVPSEARDRVQSSLRGDGEDATRVVAQAAIDAGLDARREVRGGDPATTIVSYAVENDVDVVVMGTKGKTGFERYLLGSVAEKIVRVSPIPVLTIGLDDPQEREAEIAELIGET